MKYKTKCAVKNLIEGNIKKQWKLFVSGSVSQKNKYIQALTHLAPQVLRQKH